MLTIEKVREWLLYLPDTGEFIWRKDTYRMKSGDRAGSVGEGGYVRIGLDGVVYQAGRLAWFYIYGKWPEGDIDHEDQQPWNNRLSNLRDVPRVVNAQNRKGWGKYPKGVYRDRSGRFRVMIFFKGKHLSLGTYGTVDEADQVAQAGRAKRDLIQRNTSDW